LNGQNKVKDINQVFQVIIQEDIVHIINIQEDILDQEVIHQIIINIVIIHLLLHIIDTILINIIILHIIVINIVMKKKNQNQIQDHQ
jgi:hypothetical protein